MEFTAIPKDSNTPIKGESSDGTTDIKATTSGALIVDSFTVAELLVEILKEMQKMNLQLSLITDNETEEVI